MTVSPPSAMAQDLLGLRNLCARLLHFTWSGYRYAPQDPTNAVQNALFERCCSPQWRSDLSGGGVVQAFREFLGGTLTADELAAHLGQDRRATPTS